MKLTSYLVRSRHGIYYLRLQRFGIDKRISLRTQDLITASITAHALAGTIAVMDSNKTKNWSIKSDGKSIEITTDNTDADRASAHDALDKLLVAQAIHYQSPRSVPHTSKRGGLTQDDALELKKVCLRDAIKDYELALAKSKQAEKSKKMALSTLNDLSAKLGADFDMSLLDDESIESGWLEPRLNVVAATTAKRDLSFIRAFVTWAADKKRMYCAAPLTLNLEAKGTHWSYLDASDLKLIFGSLPAHAERPWHLWIPILGLYFGARVSELASLKTSYFYEKSSLQVMHLAGTKTDASPRDLPIHGDLIALGLLDYVKTRRDAGYDMLFDITRSEQNGWGAAVSKWFTTYKQKVGITDTHKVYHSFRHTIIDLLNQFSVGHKAQCQYTGHSSASDVHSKVYGRGALSLQVMQTEVVDKINWQSYCGWQPDLKALKVKADQFLK